MKKRYMRPVIEATEYELNGFVTISWSNEETDEVLAPDRGETSSDWEEDFWEGRE